MSTISVSGLSSLYQSPGTTYAPQVQTPDSTDSVDQSADPSTATTDGSTQVQPPHHHRHGGGGGAGGAGFFSKLQSAVTTALQSAQAGGAGTDPNQAIQNAIESVLKGSDGTSPDSTDPSSTSTSTTPTATETDSSAPVDPQAAREQFFQTLQSYGVDPQQFHQDFLSALQDSKNGNSADPSSVFQSLPPGSVVDTTG